MRRITLVTLVLLSVLGGAVAVSIFSPTLGQAEAAKVAPSKGAIFHITHHKDDAHRVIHPLRRAVNFAESSVNTIVYLDIDAAQLAFKNSSDIEYKGFKAKKLLADFVKAGGSIRVCGACIKANGKTEADLDLGAQRGTPDAYFSLADNIVTFDY